MTDYRELSQWEKEKVDKMIVETIEPGPRKNESNGFEWNEPEWTLNSVHTGYSCAICLMNYYNCLCSHD